MNLLRLTIAAAASIAAFASPATPKLDWLNPVYNFGAFREEMGTVTCEFRAVNTGDEPAVILSARANCGCTVPSYSKDPVMPGDTIAVSVAYDPSGRPGRFSKRVKITANTPNSPYTLVVRGTVIASGNTLKSRFPVEAGRARLSNDVSPFGRARRGHILAAAVNMYNPTPDTIRPAVDSLPPYIHAAFSPKAIPPGEQGSLSLTAHTDMAPDYGVVTDSFRLIPDTRYPELGAGISTVMIIDEDFSRMTPEEIEKAPAARLSADSVDFGTISSRESRTLRLTNAGQSEMIVRRLYTADPGIDASISATRIKPGKSAEITVTADPAALPSDTSGVINGRINLITNSPSAPTLTIRAVGFTGTEPQPEP